MQRRFPHTVLVLLGILVLATCGPTPAGTSSPPPATVLSTATSGPTPAGTSSPPPATVPSTATSGPVLDAALLSAGDPYTPHLGNSGYDVQHYTLRLALDPAAPTISAQATVQAVATAAQLEWFSLDFVGLQIDALQLDGAPAEYNRQDGKLLVKLPTVLSPGEPFTLTVAYSGRPAEEPSPYVPFVSHLGLHIQPESQQLFVVAEPDGARYWFPANDHPRDKATFRFELLVPAGLTGVANGVLVESRSGEPLPDGRTGELFVWEHRFPMATAFATVAVGDYALVEGTSPGGVPLRSYVVPERREEMEARTALIGQMMDWLSERLGPYPFEAFGYVTVAGLGGSLETQTLVVLDERGIENEETLVHEMAHMWFGDWVSLDSWADVWRSEGFATYMQFLWTARNDPVVLSTTIAQLEPFTTPRPYGYPLNDPPPQDLFGQDSYLKGALVAHALRQKVGDEAFFGGLRAYFSRYGGGTASHAQFQAVMEEVAGVPLDEFFAGWFGE
jgi:aminopeptidase N